VNGLLYQDQLKNFRHAGQRYNPCARASTTQVLNHKIPSGARSHSGGRTTITIAMKGKNASQVPKSHKRSL
jgi:hypothetical protein